MTAVRRDGSRARAHQTSREESREAFSNRSFAPGGSGRLFRDTEPGRGTDPGGHRAGRDGRAGHRGAGFDARRAVEQRDRPGGDRGRSRRHDHLRGDPARRLGRPSRGGALGRIAHARRVSGQVDQGRAPRQLPALGRGARRGELASGGDPSGPGRSPVQGAVRGSRARARLAGGACRNRSARLRQLRGQQLQAERKSDHHTGDGARDGRAALVEL